jgi:hypothetical protein
VKRRPLLLQRGNEFTVALAIPGRRNDPILVDQKLRVGIGLVRALERIAHVG